ncbi:hypothetical protein I5M27_03115 [Adhaeribacter sp. BT258]|uniref:Uncharacterized protein n=1 Tax=Adhaeribacter terrigena TaxID=2793070 RepID=A0ABS1C043_9BACT|nr:hypothetical protein [Adhaeribacter terrigena]MBK0401958.1 hypothetical protein [Adhaeribacter terrigena]
MENQLQKRTWLEVFFGFYVIIFSLINISTQLWEMSGNYASLLISLIGIAGSFLMYKRNKRALQFLNIWASCQLLILLVDGSPLWSVEQVLSFKFYFSFTLISDTTLQLGVNLFAILLVYCVWKLKQVQQNKIDKSLI